MKLGGFGVAIQLPSKSDHSSQSVNGGRIGTPHFMAPEVIQRRRYGKPIDVWSTGVLLHILLSGTMPFLGTKDRLYESVCAGKLYLHAPSGSRWQYVSDSAKDLVRQMLATDPEERITVDEALDHPWISDRDRLAPKVHLHETVDELRKFNSRRKLKGAVLAAVSSPKWTQFYESLNNRASAANGKATAAQQQQAAAAAAVSGDNSGPPVSSGASASSTSDFGGPTAANGGGPSGGGGGGDGDDEVTAAAVGLVLDSLDDIHCLTEARNKDPDFLFSVLCDEQLHELLNLYDQINTNTFRPFRFPPSDAYSRFRDAMSELKVLETTYASLAEVQELRELLSRHHMRALLQVIIMHVLPLYLILISNLSGFNSRAMT